MTVSRRRSDPQGTLVPNAFVEDGGLHGETRRQTQAGWRREGDQRLRTHEQRILNAVQRPQAYREVVLDSAAVRIVLSVWDGEPGRPVVVFLPGTMTHPLFYEEFLDALNRSGMTVVGMHPAGHGKSPRLPRRQLTFEAVVSNALDAVAWAQADRPGAPLLVVGSSQGGVLALAVAARAAGVTAVFAHNVLDPALPGTLSITRAPAWLAPAYLPLHTALTWLARLAPGLPVPFDVYLEMARVSADPEVADYLHTDPLGLRSYPLRFLSQLLAAGLPGPARCEVIVVAAAGDPLFSLDYTRQVYERIAAPTKELLILDVAEHLIFNACLDAVLPALIPRMLGYPGMGNLPAP